MRTKMRILAGILGILLLLFFAAMPTYAHTVVRAQQHMPLSGTTGLYNNVNLPTPSWWSGNCDVGHNSGSYPLGSSYRGAVTCGPFPPPDHTVYFPTGSQVQVNEWECTEYAMRYMYEAYGQHPYVANGGQVVGKYAGDLLQNISNVTGSGNAPHVGDVINTSGHVAVVSAEDATVQTTGNGNITIVDENGWAQSPHPGSQTWTDTNWLVSNGVTGWLTPKTLVKSFNATSYDNSLKAVSAYSADNVWAVGSLENANGTYSSLIEHWDGAHWTQQTGTINPGGASNVLYGVKALSATNVWAVGIYYSNDGHGDHALIVHSTNGGSTWSQDTSSYSGADTLEAIDGVQSNPNDNTTADAWAVGVDGSGNALTLHLGSSGHFSQQSNVTPNSNITLQGVSEYSSTDVWAVGSIYNNPSPHQTFTMHYSSGSWTINTTSPNPAGYNNYLMGVVNLGSNNVWAVGYEDTGNGFLTHLSGSTWGNPVFPGFNTSQLYGVAAFSSSNIWAVGASNSIWHSADSGTTWTQITAAFPSDMWNYGSFNGIAVNGANGNTWPVGDYALSSGFHQTLTNFFN
jgi:photosystem II stability/assembly factor-like uncharacterized protein